MKKVLAPVLVVALSAISLASSSLAQSIDMYGSISFQRLDDFITLRAQTIENYRAFSSRSGTLALQLWACSAPFTGGNIFGYKVAEANLGTLQGGYYLSNVNRQVPFFSPPTGSYFMVLVLAEWDWGQFKTVDWQNFQGTQSFTASYLPILPSDGLLISKFLGSWRGSTTSRLPGVNGQQQVSIDALVTRLGINGFSLKATYSMPGVPQWDSTELYFDNGTIQGYASENGQLISVFNGRWFVNGSTITADYDIAEFDFSYSYSAVFTLQNNTTISMSGSGSTGRTVSGSLTKQGVTPPPKLSQTITFNQPANQVFAPNKTFTLSGTATSGELVAFSSSNPNVLSISGNTATIKAAGSVTITASQGGNANYNPAPSVARTLTVAKAVQSVSFTQPANQTFAPNRTFMLDASNSSGLPVSFVSGNSNVVTISNNIATIRAAGSVTITATNSGNANFNASGLARSVAVGKAAQNIRPFVATNNVPFGASLTFTNTNSTAGLPVAFERVSGPVTVSSNRATVTGVGTVVVRAVQGGNANYNAAPPLTNTFTAVRGAQTIRPFAVISNVPFGAAVVFTNTNSSAGLPVRFERVSGPVAITNNRATVTGVGTVVVRAVQAGNTNFNAAVPVTNAFTAVKAGQAITWTNLPATNNFVTNGLIPLRATSSSGLLVTYTSARTNVLQIVGTNAVIKGRGTNTITASQSGNTNYNAAINVVRTIVIR